MRRSNRGATCLRVKARGRDPMRDYDRLPPELRAWLSQAVLPWRPASAHKLFVQALAQTGDPVRAIDRLETAQRRLVAHDAAGIWGPDHPAAKGLTAVEMSVAAQPLHR